MADKQKKTKVIPVKKVKLKKKTNLMKLHSVMNKMSENAVDYEVIKKFKIIIDASEFDITKTALLGILKNPEDIEIKSFHESFHAYIKHYLYMDKKNKKIQANK
jgi:acetolactate synthase small subunit